MKERKVPCSEVVPLSPDEREGWAGVQLEQT
jgi:hypothetical protein